MATKEVKPADHWVDPATGRIPRDRARPDLPVDHREDRAHRAHAAHAHGLVCAVHVGRRRRHHAHGGAHMALPQGRRHLGHLAAGGLGLRDHQFRLVDRHRPCRHADLGDSAALQAGLAQRHQPLCRGHDDLRRHVRRPVSADSRRPSLARLLAAFRCLSP